MLTVPSLNTIRNTDLLHHDVNLSWRAIDQRVRDGRGFRQQGFKGLDLVLSGVQQVRPLNQEHGKLFVVSVPPLRQQSPDAA